MKLDNWEIEDAIDAGNHELAARIVLNHFGLSLNKSLNLTRYDSLWVREIAVELDGVAYCWHQASNCIGFSKRKYSAMPPATDVCEVFIWSPPASKDSG